MDEKQMALLVAAQMSAGRFLSPEQALGLAESAYLVVDAVNAVSETRKQAKKEAEKKAK